MRKFIVAGMLAIFAMGAMAPVALAEDDVVEVKVPAGLKNSLSDEILTRLDALAKTVGTTVSELFNALRGDAIRLGTIQIVLFGVLGLICLALTIILARILFRNLTQGKINFDSDGPTPEGFKNGVMVVLGIACTIFTIVCAVNMVKGIEYVGAPTSYAVEQLKGIFGA